MKIAAFTFLDGSVARFVLVLAAVGASATGAIASPVPNAEAVRAANEAGHALLDRFSAPSFEQKGGRDRAGSVTIAGQTLDIADLAPGASEAGMTEMQSRRVRNDSDLSKLEQDGQEEFNKTARREDAEGAAARTMLDVSQQDTSADTVGVQWLQDSMKARDEITASFADCKPTTTKISTRPITTTVYTSTSCTQAPTSGSSYAHCGRRFIFEVDPAADQACDATERESNPQKCLAPYVSWTVEHAQCEAEAAAAGCQVEWSCSDEGTLAAGGKKLPQSFWNALGIPPLVDDTRVSRYCTAAVAKLACPVCVVDDAGNATSCTMVDPAQPEPPTCQSPNPIGNAACQPVGKECVMYDELTGQCALETTRYQCASTRTVETSVVEVGHTCQEQIQCIDGSCNTGAARDSRTDQMSVQEAMARMAVTETMLADMTYDEAALAGNGSGQLTPEQQRALDDIQMFRGKAHHCQKGYAGLVDCCGKTNSNAQELYWSIYQSVQRDQQASRLLQQGGGTSAYQQWQQGDGTYASLSNPFTSLRENVTAGGNVSPEAMTMTVWEEFLRRARAEIKPGLSPKWVCKDDEFDLAIQREVDMCSYAGSYCSQRVLGACMKRKEAYCCFNSPMSKSLRASAEPGGVLKHGSAKNPDCRGIRVDELDRIDWNAIDFTRLIANMEEGGVFGRTNDTDNAARNYTGAGQSGAMGQNRQDVQTRSEQRLSSFDASATQSSIAADVASRTWMSDQLTQPGQAELGFASNTLVGYAGRGVAVTVKRQGSAGTASATVTLVGGSPDVAGFWEETLYWGAGDTSPRTVTLMPPPGARGEVELELVPHEGTISGNRTIRITVL